MVNKSCPKADDDILSVIETHESITYSWTSCVKRVCSLIDLNQNCVYKRIYTLVYTKMLNVMLFGRH